MSAAEGVSTAQAGTMESMDCLVSVMRSQGGREIEISGSGAARFKGAMESKIKGVLDELEERYPGRTGDMRITVRDNGAMDVVLGARLEAAFVRYTCETEGEGAR